MTQWYIGLMSGTSMDGVDGALVDFSQLKPTVAQVNNEQLAPELRAELLALNSQGDNELHRAALAANALARSYAQAVQSLLKQSGLSASQISAIGAHGQTVRHQPGLHDGTGYTLQLNNPALLAELTGIDVVADFRSRDVAAGGQGAPLAPFFHRAWFAQEGKNIGVLNIGGISNLTILQSDGVTLGFDCGPGNALLDMWCQQHTGLRRRGRVGRKRRSQRCVTASHASRTLLRPAAAQEHRPRLVQPCLVRQAPDRFQC
jgi:anhydro-N-acetylmuramic acid kinase